MSGHTPGPWTAHTRSRRESIVRASDVTVATLLDEHGLDSEAEETRIADARLIAAAPELLEAARSAECLLSIHVDMIGFDAKHALATLRAAIAKAEGK